MNQIKTSIFAFFMLAVTSNANAALITSDTTDITQTAQSYSQSASIAGTSYSDVTLDLTAKGDYGVFGNEYIRFLIDGIVLAEWSSSTTGISVTDNSTTWDYTLSGIVSISDSLWNTLSSDNILDISWQNGAGVNPWSRGGADYVSYSLQGNPAAVPEPSSIALFGLGLTGLVFSRRKKSTA